jgi:tRNA-modifying protein YgfZ
MTEYRSPLLDWSGAVSGQGADSGVAWHYGDPLREQRLATTEAVVVDRSNRDVLAVPGPDRLAWLHAISSQHLSALDDGQSTETLVLSPNGHLEQHWQLTELGGQVFIDTEPGTADEVLGYLLKMRFLKRVEPVVLTSAFAVISVLGPRSARVLDVAGLPLPDASGAVQVGGGFVRSRRDGGYDLLVERAELVAVADRLRGAGAEPAGSWAYTALRIERREPRLGVDTDHRTIPHEIGLIGIAVHLDKGCYRGQETVARVQNLGRPPRRLVLVHLAGESEALPDPGTPVERDGRVVGFIGSSAQHYELGPIGLAVVKRGVGSGDQLVIGGQSAVVDLDDAEPADIVGFAGHAGPARTAT